MKYMFALWSSHLQFVEQSYETVSRELAQTLLKLKDAFTLSIVKKSMGNFSWYICSAKIVVYPLILNLCTLRLIFYKQKHI